MPDKPWKRAEREAARVLGGRRIPVPGRQGAGEDPGDVQLPGWYVEVRARRRVDLAAWWAHTQEDAQAAGARPLLVIKPPGRGRQLLAVVDLVDLAEVHRAANIAGAPSQAQTGEAAAARPGEGAAAHSSTIPAGAHGPGCGRGAGGEGR